MRLNAVRNAGFNAVPAVFTLFIFNFGKIILNAYSVLRAAPDAFPAAKTAD
jgi:hypothetical protein